MKIKRHAPEKPSSQIQTMGYSSETNSLDLEFHSGDVYRYSNVTQQDMNDLLTADSLGSFFLKVIKKDAHRWPYRKLSTEEAAQ